jgi:aerobic-type carbon monoxide dehydrogenase small subunit (CoxS/CutS family)
VRQREVTTLDRFGTRADLSILQASVRNGGTQCGSCTPGVIIATEALLWRHPSRGESEVRDAFAGNLFRSTGDGKIVDAVLEAGVAQ